MPTTPASQPYSGPYIFCRSFFDALHRPFPQLSSHPSPSLSLSLSHLPPFPPLPPFRPFLPSFRSLLSPSPSLLYPLPRRRSSLVSFLASKSLLPRLHVFPASPFTGVCCPLLFKRLQDQPVTLQWLKVCKGLVPFSLRPHGTLATLYSPPFVHG